MRAETVSSKIICSVTFRRRCTCGRIIRYALQIMVDEVLTQLSRIFDTMYARVGRPSVRPEKALAGAVAASAVLDPRRAFADGRGGLQSSVPLVRGPNADDDVWDATTFTRNRDRLLEAEVAKEFLARVVERARAKGWISD